jgi:hypothetical protein
MSSCARTHVELFGEGSEIFAAKTVDKRIHEWSDMEMRMMLSWGNYKANLYRSLQTKSDGFFGFYVLGFVEGGLRLIVF